MNFLQILVISTILIAVAFVALAIQILIKKKGKFPNTHISSSKALRDKGITCAQSFDKEEQKKAIEEQKLKNVITKRIS